MNAKNNLLALMSSVYGAIFTYRLYCSYCYNSVQSEGIFPDKCCADRQNILITNKFQILKNITSKCKITLTQLMSIVRTNSHSKVFVTDMPHMQMILGPHVFCRIIIYLEMLILAENKNSNLY